MKKFIKKLKIAVVILVVVVAAAIYALVNIGTTEEYQAPEVEKVEAVEEVEVDYVAEAQKQLDEAKRLLNEEEAMLLAGIAEKEARLEEIRKVRLSFSQAPEQVQ